MGVDFMDCNLAWAEGHHHIIVAMDYFTKQVEAIPTIKSGGETATFFVFNQIISQFKIPKDIITNHDSHFQTELMIEFTSRLGFNYDHSTPYYPHANGQVEAMDKSLNTIFQKTIRQSKSN
jgi:hypothetical protein